MGGRWNIGFFVRTNPNTCTYIVHTSCRAGFSSFTFWLMQFRWLQHDFDTLSTHTTTRTRFERPQWFAAQCNLYKAIDCFLLSSAAQFWTTFSVCWLPATCSTTCIYMCTCLRCWRVTSHRRYLVIANSQRPRSMILISITKCDMISQCWWW